MTSLYVVPCNERTRFDRVAAETLGNETKVSRESRGTRHGHHEIDTCYKRNLPAERLFDRAISTFSTIRCNRCLDSCLSANGSKVDVLYEAEGTPISVWKFARFLLNVGAHAICGFESRVSFVLRENESSSGVPQVAVRNLLYE